MLLFGPALLIVIAQNVPPPARAAAPIEWARPLAAGWDARAAGRATDAEAAADTVLRAGHGRHDALGLKIRARLQAGHVDGAIGAYDEWSQGARQDVFLLQPIASSVLAALAESKQPDVRLAALAELAKNGDAAARAALEQAKSVDADAALAALGDARAVARLREQIAHPVPGVDQLGVIDALVAAKATDAVPDLVGALDPARPGPVRAAAADGLGTLGAAEAAPKLRELLKESDGIISNAAALALARLGDPAGIAVVTQMESSPVISVRLAAAEATAGTSPTGAWVPIATDALRDPDPGTRLMAAALLMRSGANLTAAQAALRGMLADHNPALRQLAARTLAAAPAGIVTGEAAQLERLLLDAEPQIRIAAAGALLRLAGGID
jgi:HEAT repeat protein